MKFLRLYLVRPASVSDYPPPLKHIFSHLVTFSVPYIFQNEKSSLLRQHVVFVAVAGSNFILFDICVSKKFVKKS